MAYRRDVAGAFRGKHESEIRTAASMNAMPDAHLDVLVLGEVLVEFSSLTPLADGATVRMGFSGDALNVAAAAVAAGARTALVARVPDDHLGDALVHRVAELGVDTRWIRRLAGEHGVYVTHADPEGRREFAYARWGSVGSTLSPQDLDDDALTRAGVVVASGVACAVSETAAAAVRRAAQVAGRFVYDPNFRPRLTTAARAGQLLRELAPHAELVTPSWPDETSALLGIPAEAPAPVAAQSVLASGCGSVALTCGPRGVVLADAGGTTEVPGLAAPRVVDQTGAGDCLTGTIAARLALGDPLEVAAQLGVAAAALCVQGRGGTGHLSGVEEARTPLSRPEEMRKT
jgi:2-dehydro-3-deoxygluconokinase